MASARRFLTQIDALPPYRRDAALIGLKLGLLLILFVLSRILTIVGIAVGLPWGAPFFLLALILIAAQFYLIFFVLWNLFKT